jgi:hypothetical protein
MRFLEEEKSLGYNFFIIVAPSLGPAKKIFKSLMFSLQKIFFSKKSRKIEEKWSFSNIFKK